MFTKNKKFILPSLFRIFITIILLFIIIFTAGCSNLSSGKIINKKKEDSVTTFTHMKTGNTMTPIPIRIPESYYFMLESEDSNSNIITDWVEVTEEEYNSYSIGDMYP